jgi:hypothetical protein
MLVIIAIAAIVTATVQVAVIPAVNGELSTKSIEQIRHEETIQAIRESKN